MADDRSSAERLAAYSDAFATVWSARTRLGSQPVVFYAAPFVGIDVAYNICRVAS